MVNICSRCIVMSFVERWSVYGGSLNGGGQYLGVIPRSNYYVGSQHMRAIYCGGLYRGVYLRSWSLSGSRQFTEAACVGRQS